MSVVEHSSELFPSGCAMTQDAQAELSSEFRKGRTCKTAFMGLLTFGQLTTSDPYPLLVVKPECEIS